MQEIVQPRLPAAALLTKQPRRALDHLGHWNALRLGDVVRPDRLDALEIREGARDALHAVQAARPCLLRLPAREGTLRGRRGYGVRRTSKLAATLKFLSPSGACHRPTALTVSTYDPGGNGRPLAVG